MLDCGEGGHYTLIHNDETFHIWCKRSRENKPFRVRVHLAKGKPPLALVLEDREAKVPPSWHLTRIAVHVFRRVCGSNANVHLFLAEHRDTRLAIFRAALSFHGCPARPMLRHAKAVESSWGEYNRALES